MGRVFEFFFMVFPIQSRPSLFNPFQSHRIHVWYIYLHFIDFFMVNVGKCTFCSHGSVMGIVVCILQFRRPNFIMFWGAANRPTGPKCCPSVIFTGWWLWGPYEWPYTWVTGVINQFIGGGFNFFSLSPRKLGKWSANLTNIFQEGWNHQLVYLSMNHKFVTEYTCTYCNSADQAVLTRETVPKRSTVSGTRISSCLSCLCSLLLQY